MELTLEAKTLISSKAAQDKQAKELVVLDLRGHSSVTDFFMLCSGSSARQVQAIADAIDERLQGQGVFSLGREGYPAGRWVLLDYNDLVIHIFHEETRRYYDLEHLWSAVPCLPLPEDLAMKSALAFPLPPVSASSLP